MTWLLRWSLRHRLLVLLAWFGIAIAGVLSAQKLPLDAYPDTTPIQVQVNAVAPSLSPLEIERQLTLPLERVLVGLPGLKEQRSLSKFGFSQVVLTFDDDTDVYLARQLVTERLQSLSLPPGVQAPTLGPVATGLGEIFHYLVKGEGASLAQLREVQDWLIKPQLLALPGVAEVNSWGGDERVLQVQLDPLTLHHYGLSLTELAARISESNANVGAGPLERAGEASLIQGIGLIKDADELGDILVAEREGVPLLLRDIAQIREGREIRRGAVSADGQGEVVLGLGFMRMGENSHEVSERFALRLQEIVKSLPPHIHVETVYTRSTLVERVLDTVARNLFEGALLVVAILFIFLGHLRAGLIVAAAIPLSMLVASNLMLQAGIAGSLMSLGAIDFGLVVDSSVIQAENVLRRSQEPDGRPWMVRVEEAILEVRQPTLFGELIIAMVYVPILTLEGIEGKLFQPMAWTVLFALGGSLLLSLTLIPVLLSFGLKAKGPHRESPLTRHLKRVYGFALRGALSRPWLLLACALLVLANAAWLAPRLGSEFVPRLLEGSIVINKVQLASVSLEEAQRTNTLLEQALLHTFPDEIERVWTRTGTAEVATDPMGIELADIFLTLTPREQWTRASTQGELVSLMAETFAVMPGMKLIFTQPIEMRINEMLAGIRSDVGVRVFGEDLSILKAKAADVEAILATIPGAVDVVTEQVTGQPKLDIHLKREALARYGLSAHEVLWHIEALGQVEVSTLYEGERRIPITLRLALPEPRELSDIAQLLLRGPQGQRIPLQQVADLREVEGPSTVQREWGARRVVVQANVRGQDLGGFVHTLQARLATELSLPPGYYTRIGGQFEHLERAQARLFVVVPLALLGILVLLLWTYRHWQDTARVFIGLPFAAIGGVFALWLQGLPFTISAGIGFIVLSGVSVLGDMVLVSTVRQLLDAGLELRQAVYQAALTRLRPVVMTSLVAALGFVPMAMNEGFGAEIQRPLATVVIGGLLSSTLLTLFVLPVLYVLMHARASAPAEVPPQEASHG